MLFLRNIIGVLLVLSIISIVIAVLSLLHILINLYFLPVLITPLLAGLYSFSGIILFKVIFDYI